MKTSQVVLIALVTPTIVQICLAMLPKEGNKSMRCVHMPQYFWVISVIWRNVRCAGTCRLVKATCYLHCFCNMLGHHLLRFSADVQKPLHCIQ